MADVRTTASAEEVAKFEAMADSWWDPNGKFKPLHNFNPVRLQFIRDAAALRFGRDATADQPFAGLSLVDIGCGGGLLSEPMRRLGFAVTGIDATAKNIGTASVHAEKVGLDIDYRACLAEDLAAAGEKFDVVLCMEVVEHVADVDLFLTTCARLVKPGGMLVGATMNRTMKSLVMAKIGAEYILRWLPRGTHDWKKFLKPSEFAAGLRAGGLEVDSLKGLTFNPLENSWSLTGDLTVNYLLTASPAA
nr:bifunctional 2-polyprenyl-6-hydroxyphenol methylase/3-demethylubiquinol 3-O-methyltransferase UbiG [Novispirillum itersonii]